MRTAVTFAVVAAILGLLVVSLTPGRILLGFDSTTLLLLGYAVFTAAIVVAQFFLLREEFELGRALITAFAITILWFGIMLFWYYPTSTCAQSTATGTLPTSVPFFRTAEGQVFCDFQVMLGLSGLYILTGLELVLVVIILLRNMLPLKFRLTALGIIGGGLAVNIYVFNRSPVFTYLIASYILSLFLIVLVGILLIPRAHDVRRIFGVGGGGESAD